MMLGESLPHRGLFGFRIPAPAVRADYSGNSVELTGREADCLLEVAILGYLAAGEFRDAAHDLVVVVEIQAQPVAALGIDATVPATDLHVPRVEVVPMFPLGVVRFVECDPMPVTEARLQIHTFHC
ncbi:MAG: hypothetical protein WD648_14345 [Planctomycetaceae bacterium]